MTDSPSTLTFSLKSSGDSSIELRPHPWLEWEVLHISSVMSVGARDVDQWSHGLEGAAWWVGLPTEYPGQGRSVCVAAHTPES